MAYELGDVVFLPFPYCDQLAESVRQAVIGPRFNNVVQRVARAFGVTAL